MLLMACRRLIYFGMVLFGFCESLKDVRVSIPAAIKRGEKAVLICHYDLEDDSLYSVKWYKGGREFYRYTPKEEPSMKIFPITNLTVVRSASNATHITLDRVALSVSGRYSCEVSADAPSFHTALVSGVMDIVEIPVVVPTITGLKQRYKIGDTLAGNCSSSMSKPAANLTWLINGEQAPSHQTIPYPNLKEANGERESSKLGLRLQIVSQLFSGGRLKIRCSASIHSIYWKSTEKSLEEEKPRGLMANGGGHVVHAPTTDHTIGFKFGHEEDEGEDDGDNTLRGETNTFSGCGANWASISVLLLSCSSFHLLR